MAKTIDDAAILSALLTHRTATGAAQDLKISPRTIYSRLQNGAFRARLECMRADALRDAVGQLQQGARLAALTLQELMLDEAAPPAIRLGACREVLHSADLYGGRLRQLEKAHAAVGRDFDLDDLRLDDIWADADDED